MAIVADKLFCPDCGSEDLWEDNSIFTVVSCSACGGQWHKNELHGICAGIVFAAHTARFCQRQAESFRILLPYITNH